MTDWISRAGELARKTFDSLGLAARSQTSAVTGSTTSAGRDLSNGDLPRNRFVNPIGEGADPSVVRDGDRFIWCQAEGNIGVAIWVSDRLTSLGTKHVVWLAEGDGPSSKEVWAPELHQIDGRWHIYFAASDGEKRRSSTVISRYSFSSASRKSRCSTFSSLSSSLRRCPSRVARDTSDALVSVVNRSVMEPMDVSNWRRAS